VLLTLLLGYVVADFVHNPFIAPTGSAAVPVPQITLWVAGSDGGSEAAMVARDTAAAFELRGRSTAVKTLSGGSSQAVADFLGTHRLHGTNLLVVTNATLADLARDRLARLVPGAGMQAELAQQMLGLATPIGLLSTDPVELGVPRDSAIHEPAQLIEAMRAAPEARLFALPDDTWSRAQLAALVDAAGVPGHTRFTVYSSGREAVQATRRGEAGAVLATRSALRADMRAERVRRLPWPFAPRSGAAEAPRAWVALVAPPWLSHGHVVGLRRMVAELAHDARWRRALAREGRSAAPSSTGPLDELIVRRARAADAQQALARVVESR
jgi:tripartite-type tricarboxylate transporter receptor subunit TctC